MARKRQPDRTAESRAAADYYRLNLKAVDDLVNANETNSPRVSEAELRKYRSGPKLRLSDWARALLIKVWFYGATCFFFLWGLGNYLNHWLDQMAVLALALGAVLDLLVNNALRFCARTPGANDRWMMFPQKGFWTLSLNLMYACLLLFCVATTYGALNAGLASLSETGNGANLGVGPILFGVFTTAWDSLFIGIRRMARRVIADARRSAGGKGE